MFEPYRAKDRRCYWGCPSADLRREMDAEKAARDTLAEYGIRIVWFPRDEFYVAFNKRYEILTEECRDFWKCCNSIAEKHFVEN